MNPCTTTSCETFESARHFGAPPRFRTALWSLVPVSFSLVPSRYCRARELVQHTDSAPFGSVVACPSNREMSARSGPQSRCAQRFAMAIKRMFQQMRIIHSIYATGLDNTVGTTGKHNSVNPVSARSQTKSAAKALCCYFKMRPTLGPGWNACKRFSATNTA